MRNRQLIRLVSLAIIPVMFLAWTMLALGAPWWRPMAGQMPSSSDPSSGPLAPPQPAGAPTWRIETVDGAGQVGKWTSLATDAAGCIHISYVDESNGALMYARYSGSFSGGSGAGQFGLVESSGRSDRDLDPGSTDAVGWQTEPVYSNGGVRYSSLALDPAGRPHISYGCTASEVLPSPTPTPPPSPTPTERPPSATATVPPPPFATATVPPPRESNFGGQSIASPHPTYGLQFPTALCYAWHDGASWHTEIVASGVDVGHWPSLALDTTGRPHISYLDYRQDSLMYTFKDGASWEFEIVDGPIGGWAGGTSTSLVLDTAGRPHISYGISTLAPSPTATPPPVPQTPVPTLPPRPTTTVPPLPTAVKTPTIPPAPGPSATATVPPPHAHKPDELSVGENLVFPGQNSSQIRYAWSDGSDWKITTVYSSTFVGDLHSSLQLDPAERPHIAFYQGDGLKYAHFDGATWQLDTVDGIGDVGRYPSLSLDAASRPHISYYDRTDLTLKYAYHNGVSWINDTVDSASHVGRFTSMAVDGRERLHISYYDDTQADLKHAWGIRSVFLFTIFKNYTYPQFPGPWEAEDNDDPSQANGALSIGQTYYGYPDDEEDWFYVQFASPGTLTVLVTSYSAEGDLLIYAQGDYDTPIAQWGQGGPTMVAGPASVAAGTFYVRVLTKAGYNSDHAYNLLSFFDAYPE